VLTQGGGSGGGLYHGDHLFKHISEPQRLFFLRWARRRSLNPASPTAGSETLNDFDLAGGCGYRGEIHQGTPGQAVQVDRPQPQDATAHHGGIACNGTGREQEFEVGSWHLRRPRTEVPSYSQAGTWNHQRWGRHLTRSIFRVRPRKKTNTQTPKNASVGSKQSGHSRRGRKRPASPGLRTWFAPSSRGFTRHPPRWPHRMAMPLHLGDLFRARAQHKPTPFCRAHEILT